MKQKQQKTFLSFDVHFWTLKTHTYTHTYNYHIKLPVRLKMKEIRITVKHWPFKSHMHLFFHLINGAGLECREPSFCCCSCNTSPCSLSLWATALELCGN